MGSQIITIIAGVAVVFGLVHLISSSLIVDYVREPLDIACSAVAPPGYGSLLKEICKEARWWISAGSLGIIAGLIQMASIGTVFLKKIKIWSGLQIFVCILCIVCFSIAMKQKAFSSGDGKAIFFSVTSLMNIFFSLAAAVKVYMEDK